MIVRKLKWNTFNKITFRLQTRWQNCAIAIESPLPCDWNINKKSTNKFKYYCWLKTIFGKCQPFTLRPQIFSHFCDGPTYCYWIVTFLARDTGRGYFYHGLRYQCFEKPIRKLLIKLFLNCDIKRKILSLTVLISPLQQNPCNSDMKLCHLNK